MKQKVVLISGCSSGIGFHTAVHLSNQSYKVYAGVLDPQHDALSLQTATANPSSLIPVKLDITKKEDILSTIQQIIHEEGHIDILINNAAYGLFGPVDSCTMEEIEDQFRVNLFGTIELTHAVIPLFRKQLSGKIICISSVRAFRSSSIQGVYSATKSALEAIGLSWASTLFPWNIYVTLVEPGATSTSFPKNMVLGSYYSPQENPYHNISEKGLAFIHKYNENKDLAQDPAEIAKQIESLITNPSPPLRIQTTPLVEEEVKCFTNDPTGAVWLEEEKTLLQEWSSMPSVTQ